MGLTGWRELPFKGTSRTDPSFESETMVTQGDKRAASPQIVGKPVEIGGRAAMIVDAIGDARRSARAPVPLVKAE